MKRFVIALFAGGVVFGGGSMTLPIGSAVAADDAGEIDVAISGP